MTTRLLLVDDHKVVRSGLRMLLENEADLTIVGEAGTGQEALQLVEQLATRSGVDGHRPAGHIGH